MHTSGIKLIFLFVSSKYTVIEYWYQIGYLTVQQSHINYVLQNRSVILRFSAFRVTNYIISSCYVLACTRADKKCLESLVIPLRTFPGELLLFPYCLLLRDTKLLNFAWMTRNYLCEFNFVQNRTLLQADLDSGLAQ